MVACSQALAYRLADLVGNATRKSFRARWAISTHLPEMHLAMSCMENPSQGGAGCQSGDGIC